MNEIKNTIGISLTVHLSRREFDLLMISAKQDKRSKEDQIRWYIEEYGTARMLHVDKGERATAQPANSREIRYPENVSVTTLPADDIK